MTLAAVRKLHLWISQLKQQHKQLRAMAEQLIWFLLRFWKKSLGNSMCVNLALQSTLPINNLSAYATLYGIFHSVCKPGKYTAHVLPKKNTQNTTAIKSTACWLTRGIVVMDADRAGGARQPLPWALLRVKAAARLVRALLNSPPSLVLSLLLCLHHHCASAIRQMCQRGVVVLREIPTRLRLWRQHGGKHGMSEIKVWIVYSAAQSPWISCLIVSSQNLPATESLTLTERIPHNTEAFLKLTSCFEQWKWSIFTKICNICRRFCEEGSHFQALTESWRCPHKETFSHEEPLVPLWAWPN